MKSYLFLLLLILVPPINNVFVDNADVDVSLSVILDKSYGFVGMPFNFSVQITVRSNESTSLALDYFVAFGDNVLFNDQVNVSVSVGVNQSNMTVLLYNYSVVPDTVGIHLLNVTVSYTLGNSSFKIRALRYITVGKRLVNGPIKFVVGSYFTYNLSGEIAKFVVSERINDTFYRLDIVLPEYNLTMNTLVNTSNRRWYIPYINNILYIPFFVMPRYPYELGDMIPTTNETVILYSDIENITLSSMNISIIAYKCQAINSYGYFDPGTGVLLASMDKNGTIIDELIDTNVALGTYVPSIGENTSEINENTDTGEESNTEAAQTHSQHESIAVYTPYLIGAIVIIVVFVSIYTRKKS